MMRHSIFQFALLLPVLLLSGCGTTDSPSTASNGAVEGDARVAAKTISSAGIQCPSVGIVEDLRSITLFGNNDQPDPNDIIGYAKLEDFDGGCTYENGMVTIDLDVMFAGKMGAKAMTGRTTEPSIAFPYFVAISDNQGNVLNKEVFAVALRFREGMENTHQVEHLKPRIPISNPAVGGQYQVLIGFQLNRQQLEFNRGG